MFTCYIFKKTVGCQTEEGSKFGYIALQYNGKMKLLNFDCHVKLLEDICGGCFSLLLCIILFIHSIMKGTLTL